MTGDTAHGLPSDLRVGPQSLRPGSSTVSNWRRAVTALGLENRAVCAEENAVQRSIEILIGKLVTDEDFRRSFHDDPRGTLETAVGWGLELTRGEVLALVGTDHSLWDRVAGELDARLQKASLKSR